MKLSRTLKMNISFLLYLFCLESRILLKDYRGFYEKSFERFNKYLI